MRTLAKLALAAGLAAAVVTLGRAVPAPSPPHGVRLAPPPGQADVEISAGRAHFEEGRFPEALVHFARARLLAPDDWRGHAYQAMTLLQVASAEPDADRRHGLLQEAETVAGVLVKRNLVGFHDPLYKFIRGVALSIRGESGPAYAELAEALRAPSAKFAPYAEIELRTNLERAFARATVNVVARLITVGRFEPAEIELERIDSYLPERDPDRPYYERLRAVVAEQLGKVDDAVRHLRACMRLSTGETVREELTGVIAMIYINQERLEEGRAVLAEVGDQANHPELVAARCTLRYKEGMRERGAKLDLALAYLREAIRKAPPDERYRLVEQFADLVRAKVGPREVEAERKLLDEGIALILPEIERRPECPGLYYSLYRIYKLLGEEEKERHYQDLYERRSKEWDNKEKYDDRGRPRCR